MIVPGAPNPLLWGEGDPLDELGVIKNSVRLNSADAAHFTRTPGATGNRQKFTFTKWIKLAEISKADPHTLLYAGADSSNCSRLEISNSGAISYSRLDGGVAATQKTSTRVQRDPCAHFMLTLEVDTTLAVAEDRYKIYVGDERITNWSSNTIAAQNSLEYVNHTVPHAIGRHIGGSIFNAGAYISAVRLTDGSNPGTTAFARRHPKTNQLRPISYAGSFGTNGFHLDFSDGSAATSTALGADRSGNGNNWTPVNISVAAGVGQDWMIDTPTKNLCVLNPIEKASDVTLSDGNLQETQGGSFRTTPGSVWANNGKWYAEMTSLSGTYQGSAGVVRENAYDIATRIGLGANQPGGYGYNWDGQKMNNGSSGLYGATFTFGDVIGIALDLDAGTLTFYKNGVSQGLAYSGLPAGSYTFASGHFSSTVGWNFGQRPFAFAAPSGFKTLCTKNLPYPSIPKSTNGFVAVTDSGANIVTTLSAAAPWPDWIRIYKRREAAEGWRWQFSDDAANYMDSSSTAAKAAFPALSGTSYVGFALRVGTAYGVATGTFAHVNGAADTITDGFSNARKMILLKRTDGAGSWFVYHPDLTAGKLLYLEQAAVETVDGSISTVLASSFVAAATLPSGTYRWIALSETDGFISLRKHTGNGNADGVFKLLGHRPNLLHTKRIDSIGNHYLQDAKRSTYNPTNELLTFEQASGEFSGSAVDIVSSGMKIRNTDSSQNAAGGTYVSLSIAEFPFRYANAR